MTSKAMWEVDPETRSKLQTISKDAGNSLCCDCAAPSPQWASPKFGIFICLSCAGVHRGLGVHISFVRSISMDAFKASEIERMRLGGNARWREFFEEHEETKMLGLAWDDATIAERYSGAVGEEWKERLSAKVEGRDYVPGEARPAAAAPKTGGNPASASAAAARSNTPLQGSRTASPSSNAGANAGGKVKVDDKYFAKLGADNASRPDDLPPSQGGKYAGFGSSPLPTQRQGGENLPNFDDIQKDPVAALTKGFGWFTSTVSKTAKSVNSDFIQPTAKQFAESDFAAQARTVSGNVARSAQAGARNAQTSFNRFVEGPRDGEYRQVPIDESRRGFWDDFSSIAEQRKQEGSSIGTSAMGKGPSKGPSKGHDEWDDW